MSSINLDKEAMTTTVFIDSLRLHACHGVLPQERTVGNDYDVTVRVEYPFLKALDSDDVADTLNYADLAAIVKQEMSIASNLVEHVAGRIIRKINETWPDTLYIYIKVKKIAPPMPADCDGAGVEMEWEKP